MRKDVGVDGDAQRLSQLAWMLFLKIFDDRESEWELLQDSYVSPLPEQYRWRNWAAHAEGMTGEALKQFLDSNMFPALQKLEAKAGDQRAYVIRSVFEDAYNYMKSGQLIRQVVNKIQAGIDFNKAQERHLFGDVYEQLLRDLQAAGNAGEFYTPRAVTEFMVRMVNPRLGEKIMDPACGTGGFLTCSIEHIRKQDVKTVEDEVSLQASILGIEKKPMPHLLCTTNMILHGIDVPINIRHDNTLSYPLISWGPKQRVDVIVTNPPFGGVEEDGVETNFPAAFRTRETADLFLVLIMQMLKDGGRAAIVLPDGSLTGDGVKQRVRQKLLEDCNVDTIIRLPNSVFKPYATVATNLVFFTKGSPTKEIWYYQHDCPPGIKAYSKTNPIDLKDFDAVQQWWNNRAESKCSWRVSIEEIRARQFDLDIKNPVRTKAASATAAKDYIDAINIDLKDISAEIEKIFMTYFTLSEYKFVELGDICRVEKGQIGITKATPGGYPLVTTGEARKSHNEYQFDCEAVCIPLVSSTGHGHASIKRIHYQSGKFALGNILAAAIPFDDSVVSAKFLYFYLNNFKDDVVVPLMKGMANVTLSTGSIKQIKVILPSMDDQERLVTLMDKCEKLRDTLLKSMTDAESMIKAVLSEIIGTKWMESIQ